MRSYAIVSLFFLLAACGGGGGSSDTSPSQAPPGSSLLPAPVLTQADANVVRGSVLIATSKMLAIRGSAADWSPVADGAPVVLLESSKDGKTTTVLATTTVNQGKYSFNLSALGKTPNAKLFVKVETADVTLRSVVGQARLDISPITEAGYQILLSRTASLPNGLDAISPAQIRSYCQYLALIETLPSLLSSPTKLAVDSLIQTIGFDKAIAEFFDAVRNGKPESLTTEIAKRTFPLEGDWKYQVVRTSNNGTPQTIERVLRLRYELTQSDLDAQTKAPISSVFARLDYLSNGIDYTQADANDFVSDYLIAKTGRAPYLRFSLDPADTILLFDIKDVTSSRDFDRDNLPDRFSSWATIKFVRNDTLQTSVGKFRVSVYERRQMIKVVTSSKQVVDGDWTETFWVAPDVGVVNYETSGKVIGNGQSIALTEVSPLVESQRAQPALGITPSLWYLPFDTVGYEIADDGNTMYVLIQLTEGTVLRHQVAIVDLKTGAYTVSPLLDLVPHRNFGYSTPKLVKVSRNGDAAYLSIAHDPFEASPKGDKLLRIDRDTATFTLNFNLGTWVKVDSSPSSPQLLGREVSSLAIDPASSARFVVASGDGFQLYQDSNAIGPPSGWKFLSYDASGAPVESYAYTIPNQITWIAENQIVDMSGGALIEGNFSAVNRAALKLYVDDLGVKWPVAGAKQFGPRDLFKISDSLGFAYDVFNPGRVKALRLSDFQVAAEYEFKPSSGSGNTFSVGERSNCVPIEAGASLKCTFFLNSDISLGRRWTEVTTFSPNAPQGLNTTRMSNFALSGSVDRPYVFDGSAVLNAVGPGRYLKGYSKQTASSGSPDTFFAIYDLP